MLLIPNATSDRTKSRLYLLAHPGNQQSCSQEISIMQCARADAPVKLDAIPCDQHALVINAHVSFIQHVRGYTPDRFFCKQLC